MHDPDKKERIASELAKSSPDWRLVEQLSREEVDQDPGNVRFSVDAGHIQRLGVELVGKKETALSELIKNSYDADSSEVDLEFTDSLTSGGTLVISDNGSGMPMKIIRDSWMRISTHSKAEEPLSPIYKRQRAGRKGIGRFAVQRLAKRLELTTKPIGEPSGYRVTFDWDGEFTAGRDLHDIFTDVQKFEKPEHEAGTELRMVGLRDAWTSTAISRVWRAILLLQPPFQVANVAGKTHGKTADPGFTVRVNGETNESRLDTFSIEKDFLSQALATIEAKIDSRGNAKVRVSSRKLDLDDEQVFDETYEQVGPVEFTSRYFIYNPDTLSGMRFQDAVQMGRKYGGIRIYRNGFRVLPYGEPSDDWLGMDSSVARREFLAPGNNRNFFGQVSISSDSNPELEETASREGLQENDAFDKLRDFVKKAVVWAINRIASARDRKQTASQPKFVSKIRPPSKSIRTAIELIEDTTENGEGQKSTKSASSNRSEEVLKALKSAEEDAKATEDEFAKRTQESLQYEAMLRLLASLGLSISVFGHEVKGAQEAIKARLQLIREEVEELPNGEEKHALLDQHDKLEVSTNRLLDIGGYIAGLMSKTESRELKELSVGGALKRFTEQFSNYMAKQRVAFTPSDVEPSNLRTTEMHASELDSVLLNLLTNSIKSMKKAKVAKRHIKIDARRQGKHLVIGFEDNGLGIPDEQKDRVFDAFYTTTLTADDDGVSGPGTGLGLKIVSDIANSYGGSVSVADASEGFTCRIEFRVLASEETQ